MMEKSNPLVRCRVCPRNCGVDRTKGEAGFCGLDDKIHVSWAGLHFGEEPCLTGTGGVGNFFFTSCNLACVYCQNWQISHERAPDHLTSPSDFAKVALELEAEGAHFIGLVSPSHQVPQIREALLEARKQGLKIPYVYNSSGYDTVESLKSLDGLISVYLPDLKYADDAVALRLSKAENYVETARNAIMEMHRQAGDIRLDPETGLAVKGLWVRHLVLPGGLAGTWESLCFLAFEVSRKIGISMMSQYDPLFRAGRYPEINRRITAAEYDAALDMAHSLGFAEILSQDLKESPENAVPDFSDEIVPFKTF